jgi:hypothetical protein
LYSVMARIRKFGEGLERYPSRKLNASRELYINSRIERVAALSQVCRRDPKHLWFGTER